ncbi:hypothetical protein [Propionivibrio limicola]|uniref:hypothetical protein n=1 Tax=Propionivibrio limicola TaxID=167645 RepID=UPI00129099C4|nr:hypothetical protein [Propionivibrio limicola]
MRILRAPRIDPRYRRYQPPDFDLDRRLWRIPLAKSGKARHVPLSDRAVEILTELPRWDGCPYVLPNPHTKKPFVSVFYAWDTARRRAGMPELRMHDLRQDLRQDTHTVFQVVTRLWQDRAALAAEPSTGSDGFLEVPRRCHHSPRQ